MKLTKDFLDKNYTGYPITEAEVSALKVAINNKPADELSTKQAISNRKAMIDKVALENPLDAFERYLGKNDLLPINYLEVGRYKSMCVGRLCYFDVAENSSAVATGFLISGGLIMTNFHVFPATNSADFQQRFHDPVIEFDYENDVNGKPRRRVTYKLEPATLFYGNSALDFAIIAVAPQDVLNQEQITSRGYLVLDPTLGKADMGDTATIIQHPEGGLKQIALRQNEIIDYNQPNVLIYQSDTAKGSSGAPVFNNEWQVIALHSAGVAKRNADGEYLDKDGNVIVPDAKGKIDSSRVVWISNNGIRVSAIINDLRNSSAASHPLVRALFSPAYTDERSLAYLSRPTLESEVLTQPASSGAVQPINTPVQPVYINIQVGSAANPIVTNTQAGTAKLFTEEKKYEDNLDFSDCKGFDEYFMGDYIPMPKPSEKLKRRLAHLIDNPNKYILNYHHYSTMHHTIRRQPVVSAINVLGNRRYKELQGRNDKWFRDNRIDYSVQLNDEFYIYSNFDKGHLARREDAEWGGSMAFAELAANLTCGYTNACPMVPALNRYKHGGKGKWGQLEDLILEKGVTGEKAAQARINVFNGPFFDDENDGIFKGVQIPMDFWKLVVWRNASNQLQATAYTLTQKGLTDDIAWEKLNFDEVFVAEQRPVSEIEERTGLKFHKIIVDADTFGKNTDEDERLVIENGVSEKE